MIDDLRLPGLHARVPVPMLRAIDTAAAQETDGNRSNLVRALLTEGLKTRGLWPPRGEEEHSHAP